jgi:hypothetical protein
MNKRNGWFKPLSVKFDMMTHIVASHTMSSNESIAQNILYELWYSVAETLFQRVCDVTELNEEQREALRNVALRPNDFQVRVEQ